VPISQLTESPTKYGARHARTESMKLDQLYFQRQKGHSPSASLSRLSTAMTPLSYTPSPPAHGTHSCDVSSMTDQLNTISSTTTTVLTTLQTLMRRSRDNAQELDILKKQVIEAKERDSHTVDEIKRLLSTSTSSTDFTPLLEKLETLRPPPPTILAPPPPPPTPPSAHKLDEEKEAVETILTNANQVLTHLLTLTDSITNLTTHLNNTTSRLESEQSSLEELLVRKSGLEAEVTRLEATIHLRNLELAQFSQKAQHLEARILQAKTAVQVSGSKTVKMKRSPVKTRVDSPAPITPQRRILSMSSTNNKIPGNDGRKTSWSKKLGGMLSGLTNTHNKENTHVRGKTYLMEDRELGLTVPSSSRRSVSTKV
jgi:hypothetical protein